jgi:hypothetical protein
MTIRRERRGTLLRVPFTVLVLAYVQVQVQAQAHIHVQTHVHNHDHVQVQVHVQSRLVQFAAAGDPVPCGRH